MSEPVNEDRVQRLEHFNPGRAEAYLPAGRELLSENNQRAFDALVGSADLPKVTTAAWLRNTLRGEGKGPELDALLKQHHPELGDQLSGTVDRFTQAGRPGPEGGRAASGDGAQDNTGAATNQTVKRDGLTR